jgi:predicted ribonuclease toxin of YeeF-YezG toxin-antitoxin module
MSSRRHEYETLRDQLLTLKSSFQAIVELDDEFQGKGADAIKGFYGAQIDVVEIWIQLAESNIAFFNGIQGDAEGRNLSGETVELPFLEEDLHQSERRSDEMITAQQQELQRILNRISDIHPLNVFSRDRFDTHMQEAGRQREDTLDSVNRFDEELKREYQHLEVSEQILAGLMRELMESSRQGNHISPLYFNAAAYYSSDAYQLTGDITAQTDSYLTFKEAQEQAREPKPVPEEDVNENPITESLNSFKEIGQDLWAGMEKRNETKFDSVYDFGNYITAGTPDLIKGFASGLNERAEVATDSGSDFINYLTMGGMDLFNGAVNPDDTYSKEHWLNSFGLAALLVGGAKPGLKVKGGTNISTPAPKTVPKVSLNHRWDQIRLGIDDLYKRPMMVADNGMLIGGEPGWSRFSVERTVKERERGTGDRVGTRGTGKGNIVNEVKETDFGKHIIKGENGKKQLLPNTKYVTNDHYKYTTDEFGRIVSVEAPELVLKKANRNKYAQANVGGKDRLPDDDGGHLIGAQFNGPPDIDNLVPQNSQINRSGGAWFDMETEWAKALREVPPKKVSVNISPIYSNNSMRPDSFTIKYKIEGKRQVRLKILNKSGG